MYATASARLTRGTCSLVAVLAGCVPISWPYERIDAPEARYFKSVCHASVGPPSVAYYPYHGIFLSLDITDSLALGLHLPDGTSARLDGNTVRISGTTETGSVDVRLPLRAARQGSLGNGNPFEFSGLPDPYSSPDNFGPFLGASKNGRYVWHLFISETDIEPIRTISTPGGLLRGTIELPPITIGAETYPPQILHFERHVHRELSPANC
jgi:hypothetical protein